MLPFAGLLLTVGVIGGCRTNVLMLFPATLVAWAVTIAFCAFTGVSTGHTVLAAFFSGACLQFGYMAGAAYLHRRIARVRGCRVIVARR